MKKLYLNPDGLWKPPSYTQVIAASGGTTVYIAGQPAYDEEGRVVAPGDLRKQMEHAFANATIALKAVGGGWDDVVRVVSYVVDYRPEHRALLGEVRSKYFDNHLPTSTLVGVQALGQAGAVFEIDVTAVIG
jgi:enamine deaminase RidA (YjgF/YER057c/UK114 family)